MKNVISLFTILCLTFVMSCSGGGGDSSSSDGASTTSGDTYDLDANGVPRFISNFFTQLAKITKISRFRSGAGHDSSDSAESCRSMKHYYEPFVKQNGDIELYSPVDGAITGLWVENVGGSSIGIKPDAQPAFLIQIYHVDPVSSAIAAGKKVRAGELLGWANVAGRNDFDIEVSVQTPSGMRLVSYFETMADTLFANYLARGATSRNDFIISKGERDAKPLTCSGEEFTSGYSAEDWVSLN